MPENRSFPFLRNCLDFLCNLIFPIECVNCGCEGKWLCEDCFGALRFNERLICHACSRINNYGDFCDACANNFYLDGILSACDYADSAVQKLLKNIKYKFARNGTEIIGDYLACYFYFLLENAEKQYRKKFLNPEIKNVPKIFSDYKSALIIPIPLHKRRLNWRGFNQAQEIAVFLRNKFGIEMNATDMLRIKNTKVQANLVGDKRKNNVKNCFVWRGEDLKGRNIILVDDIATTGSTLNECAKQLYENGAGEIWGLTVLRG